MVKGEIRDFYPRLMNTLVLILIKVQILGEWVCDILNLQLKCVFLSLFEVGLKLLFQIAIGIHLVPILLSIVVYCVNWTFSLQNIMWPTLALWRKSIFPIFPCLILNKVNLESIFTMWEAFSWKYFYAHRFYSCWKLFVGGIMNGGNEFESALNSKKDYFYFDRDYNFSLVRFWRRMAISKRLHFIFDMFWSWNPATSLLSRYSKRWRLHQTQLCMSTLFL